MTKVSAKAPSSYDNVSSSCDRFGEKQGQLTVGACLWSSWRGVSDRRRFMPMTGPLLQIGSNSSD